MSKPAEDAGAEVPSKVKPELGAGASAPMTFGTGGSTFDLRLLGQLVHGIGASSPNLVLPFLLKIYWYACCLSFGSGISATWLGKLPPRLAFFCFLL
jgi:hypothetical protein